MPWFFEDSVKLNKGPDANNSTALSKLFASDTFFFYHSFVVIKKDNTTIPTKSAPVISTTVIPERIITVSTITVFIQKFNSFSKENYNFLIDSLAINTLKSPSCALSGCFCVHGYYYRWLKISGIKIKLRIIRVICSECGHTHAILPFVIVLYSQVQYNDQKAV